MEPAVYPKIDVFLRILIFCAGFSAASFAARALPTNIFIAEEIAKFLNSATSIEIEKYRKIQALLEEAKACDTDGSCDAREKLYNIKIADP